MKNLILIGVIFFGIYVYSDYREGVIKEKQKAREVACQANPVCRDGQANQDAKFKSILSEELVRSSTGVVYYKGNPCSIDCSGHSAGYRWAEKRGISKDMGCTGYSQSFIDGCLTYVQERMADLKVEDEIEESDDRESCTPGRYGDC